MTLPRPAAVALLLMLLSSSLTIRSSAQRAGVPSQQLYAQAVSKLLDRQFPSQRAEYLLLNLESRQPIALRWPHLDQPIPVGSLLKPFLALAYAELHTSSLSQAGFPTVRCHGKLDGCWHPAGHGDLTLVPALAQSCNAYFLALARDLAQTPTGVQTLQRVAEKYSLPSPPITPDIPAMTGDGTEPSARTSRSSSRSWIGLTPEWRISPSALANAYALLATQTASPIQQDILTGMRQAALPQGTAAKLGPHPGGVLAKTGTAPCVPDSLPGSSPCIASGDGLVVVLYPADSPKWLLLVRKRGTTGAETAAVVGQMLTQLEAIHGAAH